MNIELDVELGEDFNKLLNRMTGESLELELTSKKASTIVKGIELVDKSLTEHLPSTDRRRSGKGRSTHIHNEGGSNHLTIPPGLSHTFRL